MKPTPLRPPGRGPKMESAAALITTLIFLVLIAIMILAMSDSLRVERGASVSYVNEVMSTQMAERGINHITATLNKETGDIRRNWISQPGQLVLGAEEDNGSTLDIDERTVLTGAVLGGTNKNAAKIVPLHSGIPSGGTLDAVLQPPNLNIATWDNAGEHLITDAARLMQVKWVYVRESGRLDKAEAPSIVTNKSDPSYDPIIGRYAFWADDESTKVNLNLAWSGTNTKNTLSAGSPTRISLAAIPGFTENDAEAFHNYISADNFGTLKDFFNSPNDARRIPNFATKLRQNKFDLTHYNHDPQTTFFNEKRIVLTTQKSLAGNNDFLDILKVDNTDPGWVERVTETGTVEDVIDPTKLSNVLLKLVKYLERTDWPMVPSSATSKSFQAKYFDSDPDRLGQLAIGIIEYVRSVESAKSFIEPIRVKYDKNLKKFTRVSGSVSAGADDTFIGSPRRLYITELGVWRADALETTPPHTGRLKIKLYVELHLSANGGIDSVDLLEPEPGKRLCMYIFQADQEGYAFLADGQDAFIANDRKNSYVIEQKNIIGGNRMLNAGGYKTLMFEFYYRDNKVKAPLPDPVKINVRYGLTIAKDAAEAAKASRIELAPLGNPPAKDGGTLGFPIAITAQGGIPEPGPDEIPAIGSFMTDDPRVNATYRDWFENDEHTFGAANTPVSLLNSSVINPSGGRPPRDHTSANKVTDVSFRVPYPKDPSKGRPGIVKSAAELGFVHTGIEGKAENTKGGVSWRTLRLQATKGTTSTDTTIKEVPDWALMDLFTVPADVSPAAAALLSPHGTGAGRININNKVEPFKITRSSPLKAFLLNARKSTTNANTRLSETEANTLVNNILDFTSTFKYGYTNGFDSPGEIVEIKGIADGGEDSEEMVRSISNFITTRSNVFGVYTIGQSLKQTSSGNLQVTGEQRQHAILERYLDSNSKVRFRTVYFRNLNP